MTTGKDTASFFENGTTEQFDYCYKLYPQVLKLKAEKRNKKPQELIRLDQWYQNELPKLIKERGKDAHMVYDELVQTMKWKQSRGKFYPQLSYLVKVNTPRAVIQETKKAFRKLPNLEQAITALSNLKGVGTTMASALLAAAAPNSAPFMADECLMAIPEIEGIDYTTKEYLNFVNHIQSTVERLNIQAGGDKPVWSPHRVELALWSHYVANDLSPKLLDEMPGPGSGGGANTNGSSALKAKNSNDEDDDDDEDEDEDKVLTDAGDTIDADDESLGAAAVSHGAGTNNTATESETDNENTNPATSVGNVIGSLQDGDSNFVSNDSTSQEDGVEPIIDENTTQTTGTTSTDDNEIVTPLASDSESNLEAPPSLKTKIIISNSGVASIAAIDSDKNKDATKNLLPKNKNNSTNSAILNQTTTAGKNTNKMNNNSDDTTSDDNSCHENSTNNINKDTIQKANNNNNIGAKKSTLLASSSSPSSSSSSSSAPSTTASAPATETIAAIGDGVATPNASNGNGNLVVGDSRSSMNEDDVASDDAMDDDDVDDEEDEDDDDIDESSNSNNGAAARRTHKTNIPIINVNPPPADTDNDSTLSSAGGGDLAILNSSAKKRSLNCESNSDNGREDATDGDSSKIDDKPEVKKIRTE